MEMKCWVDATGERWKEIIFNNYKRLDELRQEYVKRGHRTWMNLYSPLEEEWCLTILETR